MSMLVSTVRYRLVLTRRAPSFADRVLFAARHVRCCGLANALCILRRSTHGAAHQQSDGTVCIWYVSPGAWRRWRSARGRQV